MIRPATLLAALALLALPAPAGPPRKARPARVSTVAIQEPSKYGTFVGRRTGDSLEVGFQRPGDKVQVLFQAGYQDPGPGALRAERDIGPLRFPAERSGVEFHLFVQGSGGNAVPDVTYWAVVIDGQRAWATRALDAPNLFDRAEVFPNGPALALAIEPTIHREGVMHTITLGQVSTRDLPRKERKVTGTRTATLVGELTSGFHATDWKPTLEVGKESYIIDGGPKADLDRLANRKVRMKVEIKTYTDGGRHVTCLSVVPLALQLR